MVKKDPSLGVCGKTHVRVSSLTSVGRNGNRNGTIVLIERTGPEVQQELNGKGTGTTVPLHGLQMGTYFCRLLYLPCDYVRAI